MKSLTILYIGIIFASALSCARESSPSGGPEDENPPLVLKSNPPNGSVNFRSTSFEVVFDEFFVLNGLEQKLLISPPMEKRPVVKTKGKTLIVSFDEELRDSVTYTFYFQDAIQDLNANNPVENFQYVFSTGPTLDSLSVTGNIYNAFDLEPGKDIFVVLYQGTHDSLPRTTIPSYVTRAQDDGRYRIDHLVEGQYSIFGLKDANNNKKYDLSDEGFAFLDSTIVLQSSTNYIPPMPDSLISAIDSAAYLRIPGREYSLYMFTADEKRQYLKGSTRDNAFKLMFSFAMPVDSGGVDISFPGYPDADFEVEPSIGRDTFLVWLRDSLFYTEPKISTRIVYPAPDSTGTIVPFADTIDMRFFAPRPVRGQPLKSEKDFLVRTNAADRKGLPPGDNIRFNFSIPVIDPDTTLLKLFLLRDTIRVEQDYRLSKDSTHARKMMLDALFIPDSTYLLVTENGLFTDIYGHKSDSLAYMIKVRNSESYGSLNFNLSGYQGLVILQLLTDDEKILQSMALDLMGITPVSFPYLESGSYRLKLIFDIDRNGEWTTGDYNLGRQPEPVSYYPEAINVKVLWTLEQDWEISSVRSKSESLRKPKVGTGRAGSRTSTTRSSTGR